MQRDIVTFRIISVFTILICILSPYATFAEDSFDDWLSGLKQEALARGISGDTLDNVLKGLKPIERVIELDRRQPEFTQDFWEYLQVRVTKERIVKGRRLMERHRALLEDIGTRYGVQPRFLVAIWGLESNYGTYTGGFPVIASLATLAYDTRRSSFFRSELLNALTILDEGHIAVAEMSGSWAGAMGQVQFMPSSFIRFAVDADRDGRKDIWQSLPDVFASAARYLRDAGWRRGYIWGREVLLPDGFGSGTAGSDTRQTLSAWQRLGVRRADGGDLPGDDIEASLVLPAGEDGPAFLVYDNYQAILKWNNSHSYALAVCHLADRLVGKGKLRTGNAAAD